MNSEGLLHAVLVSLVTPFRNEKISFSELRDNIARLNSTPIRGYLVLGGNAESQGMSEHEREEVLESVVKAAQEKIIIAGIACESTTLAIETARKLADLGADLFRILPPHYFASKTTTDMILRFYEEIADNSPLPFILYNVPKLTGGVRLPPSAVAQLAKHPKIIGIKDSSSEGIYGFLAATRGIESSFSVLAGSANIFYPALVSGAHGGDMSLANYLPEHCCELMSNHLKGNTTRAKALHLSLYTVNSLVSGRFGVPGIKAAMDLVGYHGGESRRPFVSLGEEEIATIHETLQGEGFL